MKLRKHAFVCAVCLTYWTYSLIPLIYRQDCQHALRLCCLLNVLDLLKAFQTIPSIGIVWLLHLSSTYESMLSTFIRNEEASTHCVEALWPRQGSNLDLEFRKLMYYPLYYKAIWQI